MANGNTPTVDPSQPGLLPFITGPVGFSPATQAALQAFQLNTLPTLQNQAALAGLGNSGALLSSIGQSLATALPGFIQGDLANRIQASGLAAGIGNQEATRQLQAAQTAGNLLTGFGQSVAAPAAQIQQSQLAQALQGFQGAGGLEQNILQQQLEAPRTESLRRQSLAEAGTIGLFGGQVLPPSLEGVTTTKQSSSK